MPIPIPINYGKPKTRVTIRVVFNVDDGTVDADSSKALNDLSGKERHNLAQILRCIAQDCDVLNDKERDDGFSKN